MFKTTCFNKALTQQKPPRQLCMLLFDVLPVTYDACVVNSKRAKSTRRFLVCQGLYYCLPTTRFNPEGYREADLRLRFRICKKPVFS